MVNQRQSCSWFSNLTLSGDSTDRPSKAQASLVKMLHISAHWFVSSRLRYGEFSIPWRRYTRLPMRIWISAGSKGTGVKQCHHDMKWAIESCFHQNKTFILSLLLSYKSWTVVEQILHQRLRASNSKFDQVKEEHDSGYSCVFVGVGCVTKLYLSGAERQRAGSAWHTAGPPSDCWFPHWGGWWSTSGAAWILDCCSSPKGAGDLLRPT